MTEFRDDTALALDFQKLRPIAEHALASLFSRDGNFIWASDSPNFKYAFFGRDTATVVEHLAARPGYHAASLRVLKSLALHQGLESNSVTDERRGAIPHEIRSPVMDGEVVDDNARGIFERLRTAWSDDPEAETIVYYGELDGPARFIRAAAALAQNGVDLATEKFKHANRRVGERSLLDAVREAAGYIEDRIRASDLGLVELQPPENPQTLVNQTLRDSKPAYLHRKPSGKPFLPNRNRPRAPLEAQALSFEALLNYASLIRTASPAEARHITAMAAALRQNTLDQFVVPAGAAGFNWPTGQPYLTAMIDRRLDRGDPRQLNTLMLDPAEALGPLFAGRPELTEAIVRIAFSADFLTDCGLRSRGLRDGELFNFAEYHGALTNWVVSTHTVARRLHQQGSPRLARELWTRMLAGMIAAGSFSEFLYCDQSGRLLLPESSGTPRATIALHAEEYPQTNQAWSISAALEALDCMQEPIGDLPLSTLEKLVLGPSPGALLQSHQYRDRPNELLAQIRRRRRYYLLDQVDQTAAAHEVNLSGEGIEAGGSPISRLTPARARQLRTMATPGV